MVGEAAYSIFNSRTLDDIHREIQEVYLENARPWVIGYSGGKDSTTALPYRRIFYASTSAQYYSVPIFQCDIAFSCNFVSPRCLCPRFCTMAFT